MNGGDEMLIHQEYFEDFFNTARESILVLDENLIILLANRSFYDSFKATPQETVGYLIYSLGNRQWDIPGLRTLLQDILPKNKELYDYEVEHTFPSIGHKIMLLNARRIYHKDIGPQMILLAIEDITERKRLESLLMESETRFRRVFETSSDAILLLEKREGSITHVNPAVEKMLGYSIKESVGKKLQDIGVSHDMSDFQTLIQELNRSGIINYVGVPVKTKSGQYIDTDIYMVDRAMLAQCNIRDVTERTQAEKAARQRLDELERFTKETVQREFRIDALREKIKALEEQLREKTK
ncbi:MAG: PAS domain S-box protein [Nitrospirae bacterium]|nr:PAS domain S-box protein [Nitrospirota bacterium]